MIELFDSISAYIEKIGFFLKTFIEGVVTSIAEIKTYLGYLPVGFLGIGAAIIVFLVIFRVLGR